MTLALLALLYATLHALRLAFALRHLRAERAMPKAEVDGPVTILQPILSGDPALRDPGLIARDLRLGYVTRESAMRDYGVDVAPDGTVSRRIAAE